MPTITPSLWFDREGEDADQIEAIDEAPILDEGAVTIEEYGGACHRVGRSEGTGPTGGTIKSSTAATTSSGRRPVMQR